MKNQTVSVFFAFSVSTVGAISAIAAEPLPELLLETHYRTSDCEALDTIKGVDPITATLSDVATLFAVPCTSSTHDDDVTYRVYLFETGEIGGVRALLFSLYTPEFGWVGTDILRSVKLNAKTGEITHTTLTQWGGACGTFGNWQWNSYTLKLLEFRYRKSCGASRSVNNWVKAYSSK